MSRSEEDGWIGNKSLDHCDRCDKPIDGGIVVTVRQLEERKERLKLGDTERDLVSYWQGNCVMRLDLCKACSETWVEKQHNDAGPANENGKQGSS